MIEKKHKKLSDHGKFLTPHVLLIRPIKRHYLTSNSLLFLGEKNVLLDTGYQYQGDQLTSIKDDTNIDTILFSHYHIDHVFGCYVFPESTKMIHKVELEALKTFENFVTFCFKDRPISSQEWEIWNQRFNNLLKREGLHDWSDLQLGNVDPFTSNTSFDTGEIQIEVIHLPGHSPGHCGVYEPEYQLLFIGDIDLSGKFGPWYGWWNSDLSMFKKSVEYVLEFISKNEISRIVSSHTQDVSKEEGIPLLKKFLYTFNSREQEILSFLSERTKGVSLKQIANQSIVYQGKQSDPPFVWEYFEHVHVKKHIDELLDANQVFMEGELIFKTE